GTRGTRPASFRGGGRLPGAASVTAPASDPVVSGVGTLAGTASDVGSGLARLDFFLDGYRIAEAPASSGFTTSWNSAIAPEGEYLITAHAVDVAGNVGPSSPPVRVVVNNVPLAIAFTAPVAGVPGKTTATVPATPS